jgi:hypothetical protein
VAQAVSVAAYGYVDRVVDVPSRQVTRIIIELPIESHVEATSTFFHRRVLVTLAPPNIAPAFGVLRPDGEAAPESAPKDEKQPIGAICKLAVTWCHDPVFVEWARESLLMGLDPITLSGLTPEQVGRALILRACEIRSRRTLDEDAGARRRFEDRVRRPFRAYLAAKDVAAGRADRAPA